MKQLKAPVHTSPVRVMAEQSKQVFCRWFLGTAGAPIPRPELSEAHPESFPSLEPTSGKSRDRVVAVLTARYRLSESVL
jgi:hypothetical protein